MEKIVKGKISNALTSAAMNHVVAVANDIYDEELEKYQSEINKNISGGTEELEEKIKELSASTESGFNILNQTISNLSAGTQNEINIINSKIPVEASSENQLADKNYVDESIAENTANFRGNWINWSAVPTDYTKYPEDYKGNRKPTNNDYLVISDAVDYGEEYEGQWRFHYIGEWDIKGKTGWIPQYKIGINEPELQNDIKTYVSVGYVQKGDILHSGTTFEEVFKKIFSKELDVTAVLPSATVTNSGTQNGNVEIGLEISVILYSSYKDGYFKAIDSWGPDQPAGCPSGTTIYKKNNVALPGNTDTQLVNSETSYSYNANISYSGNTITPKTNYGNDSTVKINKGTATSSNITFTGCYRYYFVVNTSTQLSENSTFEECTGVCTTTGLLSSTVTVLGTTAVAIGDATHTKYVYVLIPASKATPTFKNELGVAGTMVVIKDNYIHNGVRYKLCTTNPEGHAGDKYKECYINK